MAKDYYEKYKYIKISYKELICIFDERVWMLDRTNCIYSMLLDGTDIRFEVNIDYMEDGRDSQYRAMIKCDDRLICIGHFCVITIYNLLSREVEFISYGERDCRVALNPMIYDKYIYIYYSWLNRNLYEFNLETQEIRCVDKWKKAISDVDIYHDTSFSERVLQHESTVIMGIRNTNKVIKYDIDLTNKEIIEVKPEDFLIYSLYEDFKGNYCLTHEKDTKVCIYNRESKGSQIVDFGMHSIIRSFVSNEEMFFVIPYQEEKLCIYNYKYKNIEIVSLEIENLKFEQEYPMEMVLKGKILYIFFSRGIIMYDIKTKDQKICELLKQKGKMGQDILREEMRMRKGESGVFNEIKRPLEGLIDMIIN